MKRCIGPNSGLYFFTAATLGTAALFVSLIGSFMCSFVAIFDNKTEQDVYTGIWFAPALYTVQDSSTGEWAYYKGCGSYNDGVPMDSKWKSAMAFSILASVIGALSLFAVYFAACLPMNDSIWKSVGFALIMVSLFQGLTLLFLSSNACGTDRTFIENKYPFLDLADGCGLALGGNMCIAATVLWFVSGVAVCRSNKPTFGDLDDEQYEEKVAPDDDKAVADAEEGEVEKAEAEQAVEVPANNED